MFEEIVAGVEGTDCGRDAQSATAHRHGGTAAVVEALAAAPGAILRQSHGSWVIVTGDRAIKIKKPVRFSFMDFSTLEARRQACHDEVRLNRELAPALYLGVRPVASTPPYLGDGTSGAVIDYAVEMRRYDERSTMEALLDAGRLRESHVDEVASRVAAFHGDAAAVVAPPPEPSSWCKRALADLDDLASLGVDTGRWRSFCTSAARRHGDTMRGRWKAGLVRDGHGDLRAEHVLLTAPVTIVDRLEFSRALRVADVADDLAFLSMDLERLGARWAADLLTEAYAAAGGKPAPPALAALFGWRRAIVRAKVALINGDRGAADALLALADRLAWRARTPVHLAVTGPPASGKSTVARRLGQLLELPVVSSDVVRKRLHGLAPDERGEDQLYSPAATARTYRELIRVAAATAASAGGVVVDATFRTAAQRSALADTLEAVRWIVCQAPPKTLAARAAARERDADRVSDAGPQVALALAARFENPDEVEDLLQLDTRAPVEQLQPGVADWLDQPSAGRRSSTVSTPS